MSRISGEIEDAFRTGSLILTANPRAARWIRREYALRMRSEGRNAWTTPPIEDWDTWILRFWQSLSLHEEDPPLLLTDLQEQQVWLRMQREDANLLVSPGGMAQLAAGAYALLCSYEAHAERNRPWGQTDAERFRHWADAFDRECWRQGWISRGHLEQRTAAALENDLLELPAEILLVGFDRLTPAQQNLLGALRARGVTLITAAGESATPPGQFLQANNLADEITICAWWVRQLLGKAEDGIRIGIVVPDLGSVRGEVERIFRRVLMPETDNISVTAPPMPFEFSLGQPLAEVPVVSAALLLLRWAATPLREEELSWLLLSGFLAGTDAEMLAVAAFDASAREARTLSMEVSLASMRERLSTARFPVLRDLHARLLKAEKTIEANAFAREMREPGLWVEFAQRLLKDAGWPGGRKADATQFQAMAKWERTLEDVALLDFDGRQMTFSGFLDTLRSHARETLFAKESEGAPVQILGALEASGQRFDALWFLGADESSWPLRGSMHPLLPYDAQQKMAMPHSSPEIDFALSRTVTQNLASSAREMIVSHAARNKDGELRPSPLIRLIAHDPVWRPSEDWRTRLSIPAEEHTRSEIEEIADDSGMIPWPREQSAGGSEVLAYQAACPFRAFAMKRLNAQPLNRSDWGLTAAERGDLLHKVLQRLWSPEFGELHSLDDLLSATREGRIENIVSDVISEVFAREISVPGSDDPWLSAYLESEQLRLSRRIREWLQVETTRVPFTVIASEKDLKDVTVSELKLRLRSDRIDQVSEDQSLLLDYKTGQVSPADWKLPRPGDPQLPLYAAFGNIPSVCGVLIARIRAGDTCISGMVKDAKTQLFADIKPTSSLVKFPYSDQKLDEWTAALLNLAEEFLRGEARVDPKDGSKTCQYCPLPGLCRIAERPAGQEEEEMDGDDA